MPFLITTETLIRDCNKIHNNFYDYSRVKYTSTYNKICIICPEHGEFWQSPNDHKNGKRGCPKCKNKEISKRRHKSLLNLILDFEKIFGKHTYNYSLVTNEVYKNSQIKIPIICQTHGIFWKSPNNHHKGQGCPKCKKSTPELIIEQWLKDHNIKFIPQYHFKDCRNKLPLPFDFYLPELNTCIEFDGQQHYKPIRFNGIKLKEAEFNFNNRQKFDQIKNQYCKDKGIRLLRIPYFVDIISTLQVNLSNQGL